MATQNSFAFKNVTVTALATAVSVLALLQSVSFDPTGMCVSLSVTFDAATYWGNSSTVTDASGALVAANTTVSDAADGSRGNTIPISQMFVYSVPGTSGVIYARFIA